jgi:Heterokaryon incompatibility protein (HET)
LYRSTQAAPYGFAKSSVKSSYYGPDMDHILVLSDHGTFHDVQAVTLQRTFRGKTDFLRALSTIRPVNHSQIDMALVHSWLTTCKNTHSHSQDIFRDLELVQSRIRLVDVQNNQLVDAPPSCKYIALSYVWGNATGYKTTTSALGNLMTMDSLLQVKSKLPQVIKDAMHLVRSLRERYLWVDSLCITQDNSEEMHQQIAQMASVYAGATLTIVALAGTDANTGLPGLRPNTRLVKTVEVAPGLYLSERSRNLSEVILKSAYNTRAWTYQERLLSRRCLYFSEEQAYFQCQALGCCEDRTQPLLSEDSDLVHPFASLHLFKKTVEEGSSLAAFRYYARFVVDYSRKQLSYQADIINAFSGLTQVLQSSSKWIFIAGIPLSVINYALLWVPSKKDAKLQPAVASSQSNYTFPSWSWSAWTGGVDYNISTSLGLDVRDVFWSKEIGFLNETGQWEFFHLYDAAKVSNARGPWALRFYTWTVPATTFSFQEGNDRCYILDGHMIKCQNSQQTTMIMTGTNDYSGTLYGVNLAAVEEFHSHRPVFVLLSASHRFNKLRYISPSIPLPGLEKDFGSLNEYNCRPYGLRYAESAKLYNVMLVSSRGGFAKRLAIGQIHPEAWNSSSVGKIARHITLI